ncbi:hypothetical protein [Ferruginibacter sp.]|uniref:hypothetical protein n=1 Tax=Ferruginibacter sp. TaxID=1940288 RepID=UPI00374CE1A1
MEALVEIPDPLRSFPNLGESSDQGLLQWISAVDHKMLGILYLLVSLLFFLIGGAEALLMRIQLAQPLNHFLSPETYNQPENCGVMFLEVARFSVFYCR